MSENRWSILSILITGISAVGIFCMIRYLYWHGLWTANSTAHSALSVCGAVAFFLSLAAACVGLFKDTSKAWSIVALSISLLSLLFYVQ